jgi:hypothetical protein
MSLKPPSGRRLPDTALVVLRRVEKVVDVVDCVDGHGEEVAGVPLEVLDGGTCSPRGVFNRGQARHDLGAVLGLGPLERGDAVQQLGEQVRGRWGRRRRG